MKTFLHVLNTWVVSILIAVVIFFIWKQFEYPVFFLVIFYVLAAATPSFFSSWAFLALIQQTSYTSYEKLFLWFLGAVVSVALNIFILLLATSGIIELEMFFILWPAYAGIVVTIILRLKQFFSLINNTTQHETNLV